MADRPGKTKPYTARQIVKLACVCCGQPAKYQWNCCADGNVWRPICPECDILMNEIMLSLVRDPDRYQKMLDYAAWVRRS